MFLPYITHIYIFLYEVFVMPTTYSYSCPILYPRKRSHASGEIAPRAIASTRFFNEDNFGVARHHDLPRLRFALILLACNFVWAHTYIRARAHIYMRVNAKVNFCGSRREKKRSHGKILIYLVGSAADPRTLDTRSTCVYLSAYTDGACMDDWEPIPSRRVRTI